MTSNPSTFYSTYTVDLQTNLSWPQWRGATTALLCLAGILLLRFEPQRRRFSARAYRAVLALISLVVPATVHVGGALITGSPFLIF